MHLDKRKVLVQPPVSFLVVANRLKQGCQERQSFDWRALPEPPPHQITEPNPSLKERSQERELCCDPFRVERCRSHPLDAQRVNRHDELHTLEKPTLFTLRPL